MNAPSLGFAVAPLTPAIGGVVTGLDLARPLSEAVIARLTATVAERHVLFFEGQTLDPAAHRRFAARFGKLHVHPVYPHVDDLPEITSIETRPGDLPDNDNWHTDVTFIETPPSLPASCRRAAETPCGARTSQLTKRSPPHYGGSSTY
jgi:taurine dioxygenase